MSTTTTKTKSTTCNGEIEEELKNALSFKQFDVVSDDSDHHYLHSHNNKKDGRDCIIAPSSQTHKKIVQEWRILEKNLPDSILVRVYENRVDLLRAVIVGAAVGYYENNNDNDGSSSSSSSSSVEVSDRFKASMEKLYSELLIAFQRSGASVGNFVERLKVEKRTTPSRVPQVAVKKKKKQPGIAKKVIWKLKKVLGVGKSKAGVAANGIVGT
ncbi:putative ubiquitin-conjugating enzyme e2 25 [Quercus suber]|uniref:Ubiquitin-conjugating enzyme e2 25 n=1 Tax=Quercus suber TaxID=58331 RepID=A0AAW0KF71_QUESU